MNRLTRTSLAALLFAASGASVADTLLVDRAQRDPGLSRPGRGMTMEQVEATYGPPLAKHAPVGGGHPQQPPITKWEYPEYNVYFEHDKAIYSVLNRTTAYEQGPKPAE